MKKQNLKSLKLNKKSISNFQVKGGLPPTSYNCIPVEPESNNCELPRWFSVGAFICW